MSDGEFDDIGDCGLEGFEAFLRDSGEGELADDWADEIRRRPGGEPPAD